MRPIALYIHIPFCARRCAYCDFNAYADSDMEVRSAYQRALLADLRRSASSEFLLRSIYIGGGTPSLCPPEWLEQIMAECRHLFRWDDDVEVSIEANPGTVSLEGLRCWRQMGIGRVSFGVQSLNDEVLSAMGRIHRREEVLQSLRWARQAGIDNLNLDFIYGYPGQGAAQVGDDMREAVELAPEHISAYALSVEAGTPLEKALSAGRLSLPADEECEAIEEALSAALKDGGYQHYEISNWCRPGRACLHNEIYWENGEYLGVGCGAVSYLGGWRYKRLSSPRAYSEALEAGQSPVFDGERLSVSARLKETIMLGLRTARGLDVGALGRRFGVSPQDLCSWCETIPDYTYRREGAYLRLTERGWQLSNEIFERLWEAPPWGERFDDSIGEPPGELS